MSVSEKQKKEIQGLLDESKASRSKWGWIFFIALGLLVIDGMTIMYTRRFGLAIGFIIAAGAFITWLGWAKYKRRVTRYESILSDLIKD